MDTCFSIYVIVLYLTIIMRSCVRIIAKFNSNKLISMKFNEIFVFFFFSRFVIYTGYPSELFYRGVGMWETIYGLASAYPIVCFVFVPIYLNLGITSVYQYLDMR